MRRDNIEAYLDIETTGLSPTDCMVTVVGIYTCNQEDSKVIQLVGKGISANNLLEALDGVRIIHTYNGSRFDLPFIHGCIGIDLSRIYPHRDLMYDCWRNNLYGRLKAVERQLGIGRHLKDVNNFRVIISKDVEMRETNAERVKAGAAIYSNPVLFLYDWIILGNNCRFVWGCPAYHMLELYNKCVSSNHLDIGVGTGFFLDHCKFPTAKPRLALMDLNPNPLRVASKRLARYNPEVHQRNVLESFNIDGPAFDSVGMMNLLHCLPGSMDTKQIVFENAKALMNPGAIVFGSTILYRGIRHNLLATLILKMNNRRGIWTNLEDELEGLQKSLSRHFRESSVRLIGCEALFWARN